MKHIYFFILVFISSYTFAQIPSNYYDSANGLNGYELKTELRNIITSGHNDQGYNSLYTGYQTTHSDNVSETGYENDNTVLLFYTENPNGIDPYSYNHGQDQCGNYNAEGVCHNREHIVPQSTFSSASPMQNDIHHVIPSDGYVNGQRGNLPFGNVATPNWTSLNGSQRGSSDVVGYSGTVFEPIDEFKGDIARALLYFAVRYQNNVDTYSWDMFNGTEDQVFETWALDMLLDWHYNVDPVDQREIDRNDAAYNYQGNANPFVDHPEYANLIWNPTPDTTDPSDPTNLVASNPTDNSIDLTWTASTDNVGVTSYDIYVDDVNTYNSTTNSFTATGLTANTNYCFKVVAKDAAGNVSGFSNVDCEMTTDNGSSGGEVDLFFSEYVEGSSTNKALEIANFTGTTVDLSNYTLKLASNSNSFSYTYTFPSGSIAHGDVFVIANSGLLVACQTQQDDVNNNITGFNGNDAIGLFKNDVLIDIIGIEAEGGTFAEDVTLIRKPSVQFPTTTFDINEWNTASNNDCSNLGSHNQTLSSITNEIQEIKIYPNPAKTNTITIATQTNLDIEIYNVLGKQVLVTQITPDKNKVNISTLNSGVYIVNLKSNNKSITKKLIKQ